MYSGISGWCGSCLGLAIAVPPTTCGWAEKFCWLGAVSYPSGCAARAVCGRGVSSFFFLPKVFASPFRTSSLFLSISDLKEDFSIPETSRTGACGFRARAYAVSSKLVLGIVCSPWLLDVVSRWLYRDLPLDRRERSPLMELGLPFSLPPWPPSLTFVFSLRTYALLPDIFTNGARKAPLLSPEIRNVACVERFSN